MEQQGKPAQNGWYRFSDGRFRYWDGARWSEPSGPAQQQPPVMAPDVPGRLSGFVCGLIGLLVAALPIAALPLGIVAIVQSRKALGMLPLGIAGRGTAVAGLVLGICAVCLTSLVLLGAISRWSWYYR